MLEPARDAEHTQPIQYERRRPEESFLYRVMDEHWPAFRERMEGLSHLPKFVVAEVDEYLRCGLLEHGFVRVQCTDCKFERLVAFRVNAEDSARRVWAVE